MYGGRRRAGGGGRGYAPRYARAAASRDKYSVENKAVLIRYDQAVVSGSDLTGSFDVVPSTAVEGMRKVKHLTVSLTNTATAAAGVANIDHFPVMWMLFYLPSGVAAPVVPLGQQVGVDLNAANQFVMASGLADPNAGPIRITTPLARNLNSGDSILL